MHLRYFGSNLEIHRGIKLLRHAHGPLHSSNAVTIQLATCLGCAVLAFQISLCWAPLLGRVDVGTAQAPLTALVHQLRQEMGKISFTISWIEGRRHSMNGRTCCISTSSFGSYRQIFVCGVSLNNKNRLWLHCS